MTIIKDSLIKVKLAKDGYALVPILNAVEIQKLQSLALDYEHRSENKDAFVFNSLISKSVKSVGLISNRIEDIVKLRLNELFQNHKFPIHMFFSKRPSANNWVNLHQDPSILENESIEEHFGVWMPLVDTNFDNGGFHLIKGSHLWFTPIQSLSIQPPFHLFREKMFSYSTLIKVPLGYGLIFDNKLLHATPPNISKNTRTSIISRVVPKESKYFTYHKIGENIFKYSQPQNYYTEYKYDLTGAKPISGICVEELSFKEKLLGWEEIETLIEKHD